MLRQKTYFSESAKKFYPHDRCSCIEKSDWWPTYNFSDKTMKTHFSYHRIGYFSYVISFPTQRSKEYAKNKPNKYLG